VISIVVGEADLRRIPKAYARRYNKMRTHLESDKDAPLSRTVKSRHVFFAARSSADCIRNITGADFR
jgi:hypothetical protein